MSIQSGKFVLPPTEDTALSGDLRFGGGAYRANLYVYDPFGRIDWFFARGLACSEPSVIPAIDAAGIAISDHEALAVTNTPSKP